MVKVSMAGGWKNYFLTLEIWAYLIWNPKSERRRDKYDDLWNRISLGHGPFTPNFCQVLGKREGRAILFEKHRWDSNRNSFYIRNCVLYSLEPGSL